MSSLFENSNSLLAQKNDKGQYFWRVPTSGANLSAKQLETNGNDLWEAGRYDEALVCYENALAKRQKNDIKREKTLVTAVSLIIDEATIVSKNDFLRCGKKARFQK